MEITKEELYHRALAKWGINSQLEMAMEECTELVLAIRHCQRSKADIRDVADEVADVEIMLEQLNFAFNWESLVNEIKENKLERLSALLKEV